MVNHIKFVDAVINQELPSIEAKLEKIKAAYVLITTVLDIY